MYNDKINLNGKLAIPENLVEELIRSHHQASNHPGTSRLVSDMSHRYEFSPDMEVAKLAARIRQECLTCQACDPLSLPQKRPIAFTVVPDKFMASVSLDIFSMPTVEYH